MTVNNPGSHDGDLRKRFAAMRLEEEGQAPEFTYTAARAGGHRRRLSPARLIAALGCIAIIVSAIFLLRLRPAKRGAEPGQLAVSITQWRSPTDFLLDTPGQDILRTVPAIGVLPDYTGAGGQEQPPGKQVQR